MRIEKTFCRLTNDEKWDSKRKSLFYRHFIRDFEGALKPGQFTLEKYP